MALQHQRLPQGFGLFLTVGSSDLLGSLHYHTASSELGRSFSDQILLLCKINEHTHKERNSGGWKKETSKQTKTRVPNLRVVILCDHRRTLSFVNRVSFPLTQKDVELTRSFWEVSSQTREDGKF